LTVDPLPENTCQIATARVYILPKNLIVFHVRILKRVVAEWYLLIIVYWKLTSAPLLAFSRQVKIKNWETNRGLILKPALLYQESRLVMLSLSSVNYDDTNTKNGSLEPCP
jgi:hypothetical protein